MLEQMRSVSDHYNNDVVVPLPELEENERPAVANFFAQGVDQHAMRIASPGPPVLDSPITRKGEAAYERSKDRKMAAQGWLERNSYHLLMRRRARHLIAYAESPLIVYPDLKRKSVTFDLRSPLDTYASTPATGVDYCPDDAIITCTRTMGYLDLHYPDQAHLIRQKLGNDAKHNTKVELATYYDGEETVVIACGTEGPIDLNVSAIPYPPPGSQPWNYNRISSSGDIKNSWAVELHRAPNLAGCCPVVVPRRISLDNPRGQFDDTPALWSMMAKMMALDVNAAYRNVFQETWLVANPNEMAAVERQADPVRGVVGIVRGGQLQTFAQQPGYASQQIRDQLERAVRINGSLPAEFSGESSTNVRTDRRGNSIQAAMTDFHIQEAQLLFAASIEQELYIAAELETAYFDTPKSFFIRGSYSRSKPGQVDYTPSAIFNESKTWIATYPYAGLDVGQLSVTLLQQVGGEMLSPRTAMEQMNNVDDVDEELRRIDENALHVAVRSSIQQQAASGAIPLADIVRIEELVLHERMDLLEAVQQAQREAQARQASSGAPGTPEGPVAPGSPEAQPGLGTAGDGSQQPIAGPASPQGPLADLSKQLQNLRTRSAVPRSAA